MRRKPKTRKTVPQSKKTPVSDPIQIDDDDFSFSGEVPDGAVTPEPVAEDPEELARENNILWGHCDNIAYMLEMNWHRIGWELERLRTPTNDRTPDAIQKAFEPLGGEFGHDLIHSLLRPTSVSATHAELQNTCDSLVGALLLDYAQISKFVPLEILIPPGLFGLCVEVAG